LTYHIADNPALLGKSRNTLHRSEDMFFCGLNQFALLALWADLYIIIVIYTNFYYVIALIWQFQKEKPHPQKGI
jgi:hypothetical protein